MIDKTDNTYFDRAYGNVPNDFGLIAIKGDHIENSKEIVDIFEFAIETVKVETINWEVLIDRFYDQPEDERFGSMYIWKHGDYTIVEDVSALLVTDSNLLNTLAKKLSTTVFSFSTSDSYSAFTFNYISEDKQRKIVSMEGTLMEVKGTPLKEESFDINEGFDFEEVYEFAKKLGYNWKKQMNIDTYHKITYSYI